MRFASLKHPYTHYISIVILSLNLLTKRSVITMKSIFSCSVLLTAFAACNAYAAEDWVTIATNSPNITFAVDKDSIQREGSAVTFWEKMEYVTPETTDQASGKKIKEKKVRRIINCKERTQGYNYGVTYAEDGSFITSIMLKASQVKMTSIPPGTIAEAELNLVCKEEGKKGK